MWLLLIMWADAPFSTFRPPLKKNTIHQVDKIVASRAAAKKISIFFHYILFVPSRPLYTHSATTRETQFFLRVALLTIYVGILNSGLELKQCHINTELFVSFIP